jgi:amidohydrolase
MKEKIEHTMGKLEQKMIQIRRDLHRIPETAFEEYKTSAYIMKFLGELGISYRSGIAGTGVVAVIRGKHPGRTIALRADMDALNITESAASGFQSQHEGRMHACGHDKHMAILLTVCELVKELEDYLSGTAVFVFQPAEEAAGGAEPLLKTGIFEEYGVEACAALHAWPALESGLVEINHGVFFASFDDFRLVIRGKGGHSAMPQLCVNPVKVAAELICSLDSIEYSGEPFILSACSVHGGAAANIIPETVEILGSFRTMNGELRDDVPIRIKGLTETVCRKHKAEYSLEFRRLYPPVINDRGMAERIFASARLFLGDQAIYGGEPSMAGEDFAYYAQRVPSAIFRLGCGNKGADTPPLHSPNFNPDEGCMGAGVKILSHFLFSGSEKIFGREWNEKK